MFSELMPLLENRPLTITVAAIGEGRIRVNVVPHALPKDSKVNENVIYTHRDKVAQIPDSAIHALKTPLSLTGTPAEIDAEVSQQLSAFVDSHMALEESLNRAKEEITAAVIAIEERGKNRSKSKSMETSKPSQARTNEDKDETSMKDNLSLFQG